MAKRLAGRYGYPNAPNQFKIKLHPDRLLYPLRIQKPTMFFVDSMSDLFHEDILDSFIYDVFDVMRKTPQHTYQILTKRAELMESFFTEAADIPPGIPLPNVWLGVSCENQETADQRIPFLLKMPAAIRFISAEPLLEEINLSKPYGFETPLQTQAMEGIDWVICGGESGPGARPMHPDWARSLRDQCKQANVPFFFKQWGGVHKKNNGHLLDGIEHYEFPIRQ
jgi:protein gp37